MYTKAARWVCDGLILETSVIGLLLVLFDSGCVDHEARQSFNDDPFLLVAELLPQARLRDGNVEEVEIQLRHGSPGLAPMLPADRQHGAEEHRRGCEGAASRPANRQVPEPVARRWRGC